MTHGGELASDVPGGGYRTLDELQEVLDTQQAFLRQYLGSNAADEVRLGDGEQ